MYSRYRIAILGATGMLGNSAYKVLKDRCDLVLTARTQKKFDILETVHGGIEKHEKIIFDVNPAESLYLRMDKLIENIGHVDLVINCVGVLNKFAPGMTPTPAQYYAINTEFPIYLSRWYGKTLIHPSTDCVFDGIDNQTHSESSSYSPSYGIYGYAKMFADEIVKEKSLVLRCCLIGDELEPDAFQMFSWIKRQKNAGGYTKHIISPVTGIEFANICWRILTEKIEISPMILHLATPPISKYQILHRYIVLKNLQVELHQDPSVSLYKVLTTNYQDILDKLRIASFDDMMKEL
jgi:dTDP-4-dehydrorhamnose reductase